MLVRKFTATSALLIAALGIATGSTHAEPLPAPAPVGFTGQVVGNQSVITTDSGTMAVAGDTFEIRSADGTVLAGTP